MERFAFIIKPMVHRIGIDVSFRVRLGSGMGVGFKGCFHDGCGKCVVFSCGCV